jgi:hypothetical protein
MEYNYNLGQITANQPAQIDHSYIWADMAVEASQFEQIWL